MLQSNEVLELLIATTETWTNKPTFIIENRDTNRDLVNVIGPTDESGRIWWFLEDGTRVRYAILSADWVSKTTPGQLRPGPGSGRVIAIDTRRPQPGIKARNWSETIAAQEQPQFTRKLRAVQ